MLIFLNGIGTMSIFNKGDRVAVLNDTIKGVVIQADHQSVSIEDEDGFVRQYKARQLVRQQRVEDYKLSNHVWKEEPDIEDCKKSKSNHITAVPEIDLHIECLVERHDLMSNFEIVQKQMFTCRAFVEKSLRSKQKKIVLIHGKGEGVLKAEIHAYLRRLKNDQSIELEFHDAAFTEYGMGGATEIIFK